jgi:hypothetical protein
MIKIINIMFLAIRDRLNNLSDKIVMIVIPKIKG